MRDRTQLYIYNPHTTLLYRLTNLCSFFTLHLHLLMLLLQWCLLVEVFPFSTMWHIVVVCAISITAAHPVMKSPAVINIRADGVARTVVSQMFVCLSQFWHSVEKTILRQSKLTVAPLLMRCFTCHFWHCLSGVCTFTHINWLFPMTFSWFVSLSSGIGGASKRALLRLPCLAKRVTRCTGVADNEP